MRALASKARASDASNRAPRSSSATGSSVDSSIDSALTAAATDRPRPRTRTLGWGLRPDVFTYTTMISGYGRAGEFAKADAAFTALRSETAGQRGKQGIDVVAVNAFMDACVRCGELSRALRLLDEMMLPLTSPSAAGAATTTTTTSRAGARATTATGMTADMADIGMELMADMAETSDVSNNAAAAAFSPLPPPDLLTFSTVIMAVIRTGTTFSGERMMDLWRAMMMQGGVSGGGGARVTGRPIRPDHALVRWMLASLCSLPAYHSIDEQQASILRGVSARSGLVAMVNELMRDLAAVGWDRDELKAWQAVVRESFSSSSGTTWRIDDAWRRLAEADDAFRRRKNSASAKIFQRHSWNELDSGWRWLG